MNELKTIDVITLEYLSSYLIEQRNNIEFIIKDFGEIKNDNGHGTFFLTPKNSLFTVLWIYIKDDQIKSVGFGGTHLGLTLNELYSFYDNYKEGFNRYDDEYIYTFYKLDVNYAIQISSKDKLMDNKRVIKNIYIYRLIYNKY